MRRISTLIVALTIGPTFILAAGTSEPMPGVPNPDGAMIRLAAPNTPPPPPPPKKKPPPPVVEPVPGAHAVTKGQKGKCICSTNAAGNTTCTGGC